MEISWHVEVDPVVLPGVGLVTGHGLDGLLADAGAGGQDLEVALLRPVLVEPEVDAVVSGRHGVGQQARPLVVVAVGLGVDVVT